MSVRPKKSAAAPSPLKSANKVAPKKYRDPDNPKLVDSMNPENLRPDISPIKPVRPVIGPGAVPAAPTINKPGYVDPENPANRPIRPR
jgi:hypothetical protein